MSLQPSAGEAVLDRQPSRMEIRELDAWFGSHQVLEDIDIALDPYHVTALIGPSGCGKSTFLRTLNRMHELVPDGGASRARSSSTASRHLRARTSVPRRGRGSAWSSRSPIRSRP